MLLGNQVDLLFPQLRGILIEDVEQGIVLRRGDRQLQGLTDEKWHHRATATSLWVQMTNAWHRHVISKVQGLIPILISVENGGTKAGGSVISAVSIDSFGAAEKEFAIAE